MLSGLAACAAITAAIAGVAGAWSPCGFSMVETIGSAMGDTRRSVMRAASITFTLGAVLGGMVTFGGLAFVGSLIDPHAGGIREAIGAVIALAAAVADWRGVKIAPQIRRQVPERWRWTLPLPLACALYGVLLGLGFTTFVLAFAVWALAGISFAAGDPAVGALIGVGFGLGRAAPVLWMAPSFGGTGARRLDTMAVEPRLWLGLRRLDALGLGLCALFLSGASATAAVLPSAFDPSAASGRLTWQELAGPGILRSASGQTTRLPGADPALGGLLIAWQSANTITVASSSSLATIATIAAPGVNALAISQSWLVYRATVAGGAEQLLGVPLQTPTSTRLIAHAKLAGEIGRPSLSGSSVVFAENTPFRSRLAMVNLASGARRTVRSARSGATLLNPSLLGGRLLYERVDRCSQRLLLGSPRTSRRQRTLLSLPSTATRDPGYQQGYTHAYNSASRCSNRGAGRGAKMQLGPTALSATGAYVTELQPAHDYARILAVPR
ncbi:MAG: hypothetical protein ACYDHN_09045 [Solirubrobacteraceae bacterium]